MSQRTGRNPFTFALLLVLVALGWGRTIHRATADEAGPTVPAESVCHLEGTP